MTTSAFKTTGKMRRTDIVSPLDLSPCSKTCFPCNRNDQRAVVSGLTRGEYTCFSIHEDGARPLSRQHNPTRRRRLRMFEIIWRQNITVCSVHL